MRRGGPTGAIFGASGAECAHCGLADDVQASSTADAVLLQACELKSHLFAPGVFVLASIPSLLFFSFCSFGALFLLGCLLGGGFGRGLSGWEWRTLRASSDLAGQAESQTPLQR